MNPNVLFCDFETFSTCDLRASGAYRYAEDPTTEALCLAFAENNEPVKIWKPGEQLIEDVKLAACLGYTFIAHNAEFEKEIFRHVVGFEIPKEQWVDTAAMSARMSLPRKLEEIAKFFGLDTAAKLDANVSRKGDSVCHPRNPTKNNPALRWTPGSKPEAFEALYRRCVQDVDLLREVYRRLLPLEESERKIWQVTVAMNERGLLIDRASIPPAQAILDKDGAPQVIEFETITGCKLKSYVKLARFLGLPDVGKSTVRKALRGEDLVDLTGARTPLNLSPGQKRALEIYQGLGKSSVAKLEAMLDRMNRDERVRGSFVYCGAERTARWSANGIQPQNFPRGLGSETAGAFRALHEGLLETLFEGFPRPSPEPPLTPTSIVANMLRGFIVAPPGKVLIVGDLSQIEARTLNWLAEQEDTVKVFATGGDPYCVMASRIYGREITKKQKDERFMGKQAVLGAGYGLGAGGFQFMLDETYDVQISMEFAEQVVAAYRAASPKVVAFWRRLQDGFVHVVSAKRDRVRVTRNIWMGTEEIAGTRYAWIQLPSNRKLYYADPQLIASKRGPAVEYWGRDRFSKGWCHVRTYGGKITENVTQALSRDVIAGSMLRVHAANFVDLTGTVHDEVIGESDIEDIEAKEKLFHDLMIESPPWAEGLPLEAEVFSSARYRK